MKERKRGGGGERGKQIIKKVKYIQLSTCEIPQKDLTNFHSEINPSKQDLKNINNKYLVINES